jgi:pectinesterase
VKKKERLRRFADTCLCALCCWTVVLAQASPGPDTNVNVLLIGDSTMAPRTGYGDALCAMFAPHVTCLNLARGGRSSASYRAEGLWDQALRRAEERPGQTYLLIQFGHNDQPGKPGRSTDLETEFPVNMARYVDEAIGARLTPVLVTPLTRRTFREGKLHNDLIPWAEAVKRVAADKKIALLDLNTQSATAVSALGQAEADTLAMAPAPEGGAEPDPKFDRTHLGPKGAQLFSAMVARDIVAKVPALGAHFRLPARPQLSESQARAFAYAEVLKYKGAPGGETIDAWDPLADVLAANKRLQPDYVVDAGAQPDGKRVFATVQSAVDKAVEDAGTKRSAKRLYILIKAGTYRELLYVPASRVPLTVYGESTDASRTVITADLNATMTGATYSASFGERLRLSRGDVAAMYSSLKDKAAIGTAGSATAWIKSDGFQARDLTFENAHNKRSGEGPGALRTQAVAAMIDGADRVQFENVRFLGFQDTLYLRAGEGGRTARSFFHRSYVEGNVDFIFGDGTAYFLRSEVKSLGARGYSYVAAPSTHHLARFGLVFDDCDFTHDDAARVFAGSFQFARQWFRGQRCTPFGSIASSAGYRCALGEKDAFDGQTGTVSRAALEAAGKMIVMNSRIGAHIDRTHPWLSWNADGTRQFRPVQFSSDDYWAHLVAAGIDPVATLGYAAKKQPAEPFLAEFRNTNPAPSSRP